MFLIMEKDWLKEISTHLKMILSRLLFEYTREQKIVAVFTVTRPFQVTI